MFQVIFMPLIFIPISTLNYVGVPREKNNQVSGISSFMRNIGGSIGTSGLSVFLTRQNQTHQVAFASHTSMGDTNFSQYLSGLTAMFISKGYDAATAAQKALAMAYFTVQSQAGAAQLQKRLLRHVGDDRLPEPAAVHHAASQVTASASPPPRISATGQVDTLARCPTRRETFCPDLGRN